MALLSSPLQIITNTPRTTKAFVGVVLGFSIANTYLQYSSEAPYAPIPYLTLLPSQSYLFPWTFLTAGFVEPSFIGLVISLLTLAPSFRYLERLWGSFETAKFIGIVITISNLIAFLVSWIEYVVIGSDFFIARIHYFSLMAIQTGVLVAFTQLIPEHQVQFFGTLRIRVKRLPMLYVTISNVACILGYQSPWILIQFGWLVSWAYLRFYKRTTDALSGIDTYGDRSETFAFIHWFPPFVHKPLSVVSTFTHNQAVRFKLIRPFTPSADDVETGVYSSLSSSQPGGARAEAERRRALALKALDSRLANPGSNRPGTPSRGLANSSTSGQGTSSIAAPAVGNTTSVPTRKSVDQGKNKTTTTNGTAQ